MVQRRRETQRKGCKVFDIFYEVNAFLADICKRLKLEQLNFLREIIRQISKQIGN